MRDPDEPGELTDVAAVDAALTGDQVCVCADGPYEEALAGEALESSAVSAKTASMFVSIYGKLGRERTEARCTTVMVPVQPFSLLSNAAMRSDKVEEMRLALEPSE